MTHQEYYVSENQVMDYIEKKKAVSKYTTVGVIISILSILPLLLLHFLGHMNYITLSRDVSTSIGLSLLFLMIAVSVGVFLQIQRFTFKIDLSNPNLKLETGLKDHLSSLVETYKSTYIRNISLAIGLILLSTLPLILVSILSGSGQWSLLMVIVKLLMISFGISIIIPTSQHFEALKKLSQIGDPRSIKSDKEKRTEKLAAVYWPLVLAAYLAWSLWTMAWGTTWIIWPVAAILFIALVGLLDLFKPIEATYQ